MNRSRLLLVEDEYIIALGIRKSLERLGYEVSAVVTTGEEAVSKAIELLPDLILMDIVLAGPMDGVEAARAIAAEADIPVIYLTANADSATVERARDTMPYGYMNKPINDRDLMSNIDTAIHKHHMERRLRESEEKYRSLVENINDVILSVDENGTVTYASPRAYDVAGYREEDLLGKNLINFVYPDDRELVISLFGNSRAGGFTPGQYRVLSKSGDIVWVRTSGRPIFVNGRFNGVRVIMSDITERMRIEDEVKIKNEELTSANEELQAIIEELEATNEELRTANIQFEEKNRELSRARKDLAEQEALLASISRVAPVGIGLIKDKVLHWTNSMIQAISGYAEEELLGKSLRIFYTNDEEYNSAVDRMYRQIGERGMASFEARCRHKNGSTYDTLINAAFLDPRGKEAGIVFTAMDITEKNRVSDALAASEQKFSLMLKESPFPITIMDGASRFTYMNPRVVQVLGYTTETMPTINEWWEKAYPDPAYREKIRKEWEENVRRAMDGNTIVKPMPAKIHCADDTYKWIEFHMMFFADMSFIIAKELPGEPAA